MWIDVPLTCFDSSLTEDIGFSSDCAYAWAQSVDCSTKNCAFIYIQSLMTNGVGNFEVSSKSHTSATCSEASCEAGPDYYFVKDVGANRRRMNVHSEIKRPYEEQCRNVGIPKNENGSPDWETFLNVSYNPDENTVSGTPVC
jgi:hypothetical protein